MNPADSNGIIGNLVNQLNDLVTAHKPASNAFSWRYAVYQFGDF
jgi:hypothetical protein